MKAMELENQDAQKSQPPAASARSYFDVCMSREPRLWLLLMGAFAGALIFFITSLVLNTLYGLSQMSRRSVATPEQRDLPMSFYDGDGAIQYNFDVVPNIIHLVRHNQPELTFMDTVFLRSMYLNHRPDAIWVHCDPCGFTGPFVNLTKGTNITLKPYIFPTKIFGVELKQKYHVADVARVQILRRYGGIYLDWDVFVIQSLRRFLRYEATLPCTPNVWIANNILIFHKNSRFLRLYIESFREFNDSRWNYNPAEVPTKLLVLKRQHLVNCMSYNLEAGLDMLGVVFEPHGYPNWRDAFAVHSYIYHRGESPYDALKNKEFSLTNVRDLDNAMGQMTRSVLFGTSDFVDPDTPVLSVTELAARKDRGEDLTKVKPGNAKPFYRPIKV